ncbi:MAG: hypothetical protein M3512_03665 [Bacteroidota bacterium]|nr:hypothetical protein [Bacteroidota bacterium]
MQRRIWGNQIKPDLQEIFENPVSIVLRNGKVYVSKILSITETVLEVCDMRRIKSEILIKNIDEIIIDKRAE